MGRKGRRTKEMVDIARERMEVLFDRARVEAVKGTKRSMERAVRYVSLARRIGMRYNVRQNGLQRRSFCRACGSPLVTSRCRRVRIRRGRVVTTCQRCGRVGRNLIRRKGAVDRE